MQNWHILDFLQFERNFEMVGSLFKADFVLENPFKLSSERPIHICISLEKLSVGNFSSNVNSLHFYIHCVPFANKQSGFHQNGA